MRHYAALDRASIAPRLRHFVTRVRQGGQSLRRACDMPAGSSPSMKWVNPPVAYMPYAGVTRLLDAPGWSCLACAPELGASCYGSNAAGGPEAYPFAGARNLGRRSYKSDDVAKQTPDRPIACAGPAGSTGTGQTRPNLRLKLTAAQHDALVADGCRATPRDAVLCMAGRVGAEAG